MLSPARRSGTIRAPPPRPRGRSEAWHQSRRCDSPRPGFLRHRQRHLLALDRATGNLAWETAIAPDVQQPYGATLVAPWSAQIGEVWSSPVSPAPTMAFAVSRRFQTRDGRARLASLDHPRSRRSRHRNLARQGTGCGRRLHLAHRLLRPVNRHALLGDRQSVSG